MKLTLTFMTGREEPRLDWLLGDLALQVKPDDEIEILVVDALKATRGPNEDLDRWIPARRVAPKPTIWQGECRVTAENWWATASSRNTAIVLASNPYLAFVDDRCHLGPKWLETVRAYSERDAVLIGSYDKYEDGDKVSEDHRRGLKPNGMTNCPGGWLYGCSFALPLDWALEVNGFEEGCDGLTGEDYIFGLMLSNADHRLDFVPDMFVKQDRSHGNVTCKGTYRCMDKGISPNDKSHAALERFGSRSRTEFTPDLRKLRMARQKALREGVPWSFPIPDPAGTYLDWFDGQDIRTM